VQHDRLLRRIQRHYNVNEAEVRRLLAQKIAPAPTTVNQKETPMESRDQMRAAVARLETRRGVDPPGGDLQRYVLAEEIAPDRFLLNGRELTGAEQQAAMAELYDETHALDDLSAEPIRGEDVHKAAMALLAARGNHAPTYDEYANATAEVSS
jgi:hypothetical protein